MRLFVGNLSYSTTEEELAELFGEYGLVEKASIPIDRETQNPRGYGFVDMPDDHEGNAAVAALDKSQHNRRTLNVSIARARGSRKDGDDYPRRKGNW